MGVGTPEDLIESVRRGIDMFDCVMPTRNGRHAPRLFHLGWTRQPAQAKHAETWLRSIRKARAPPPAVTREPPVARLFVRSGELLGSMLLSWNNTCFYQEL